MEAAIKYLLEDVRRALKAQQLRAALQALKGLTSFPFAAEKAEEVETLSQAYDMLLHYLTLGAPDPSRATMHRDFMRRAQRLLDDLMRLACLAEATTPYATTHRTLAASSGPAMTVERALLSNDHPAAPTFRQRFDTLWTSPAWTDTEADLFTETIATDTLSETDTCLAISAVTLSLLRFFDAERYRALTLLAGMSMESARVKARLVVGWVLATLRHNNRITTEANLFSLASLNLDEPGMKAMLEQVQLQLFMSLETKNVERRLREEILPEMMKQSRKLNIDRNTGLNELAEKMNEAEMNPEWSTEKERAKFADKMHEIAEMQQRGADVFISQFKMLQQRFAFFRTAANWFYPFTLSHPDLRAASDANAMAALTIGSPMCNTDRFALCLMVQQMPAGAMEQLSEGLRAAGMPTSPKADDDLTPHSCEEEIRTYVRDFYRFATLFAPTDEVWNPFTANLLITDYAPFSELLNDETMALRWADFLFADKSYALALSLYRKTPEPSRSATTWQRIGFCYEQLQQTAEATEAYDRALILQTDSTWTLRRQARCLCRIGLYEKALTLYERLEAQEKATTEAEMVSPESINLLLQTAECCLHLERYDEAFKRLFKADYLAPESNKAVRALAWCSVVTGRLEQAERYYAKVLATPAPSALDFVNAGHTALLSGRLPIALERYRRAIAADASLRPSPTTDADLFTADTLLLSQQGVSEEEIAMLRDALSD